MDHYIKLILLFLFCIISSPAIANEKVVSTQTLSQLSKSRVIQFPAQVINLQLANIAAETEGQINSMTFQIGDSVDAGQTLVKLNCKIQKLELQRSQFVYKKLKAKLKLTLQKLTRAKNLRKSQSMTQEEVDQLETELDIDQANLDEQYSLIQLFKEKVNYCQIKAPFSGVIVEKMVSLGDFVTHGKLLLKLLKQDAVEIQLELPTTWLSSIIQAKNIFFVLDKHQYPIKLRTLLPLINTSNLQHSIRLSTSETDVLVGGSFGIVRFETPPYYLPAKYIQKRDGISGFFAAEKNRALFYPLPEAEEGQPAIVNLSDEIRVITSHLNSLEDQEKITLQP